MPRSPSDAVYRYHDGTKHHYHRFAQSLGYLDWAAQPNPFRSYVGAPSFPLYPGPDAPADDYDPRPCSYAELSEGSSRPVPTASISLAGDILRHSLGLSAWKQYAHSRWSLRVNPSSGNLHPTESYLVCGSLRGVGGVPCVYHYEAERHALARRCAFAEPAWESACGPASAIMLVVLSSIHWRESWKYGERAFRYCHHDLGHAIAALRIAAAIVGWRARVLSEWPQRSIGALVGLDRDEDFVDAEREDAACIVALTSGDVPASIASPNVGLINAVRDGHWTGRASQLSEDHVKWAFIEEIARATEDPGHRLPRRETADPDHVLCGAETPSPMRTDTEGVLSERQSGTRRSVSARELVVQRRSAVAFDGRSVMDRQAFLTMLAQTMPRPLPPWDALWWPPSIHLVVFVHGVDQLDRGLYALGRTAGGVDKMRSCMRSDFLWEPADQTLPLSLLARGDCRDLAGRLSCDQRIAADGYFSLGMLADFDAALDAWGPSSYRHLYWEAGVVGQVLYLEAEVSGARATGIGCFYDDPVHDLLGLKGHTFQSLYHFTVGVPVDDARLTSVPGYEWELRPSG